MIKCVIRQNSPKYVWIFSWLRRQGRQNKTKSDYCSRILHECLIFRPTLDKYAGVGIINGCVYKQLQRNISNADSALEEEKTAAALARDAQNWEWCTSSQTSKLKLVVFRIQGHRAAFVCRSQKWKNLILQIPWIWNACVLMHCCSHMSWICNIWIKNIFNTWKNPPLGSFCWSKCCKKYIFKLKILFECDQWPFYAELREGTRCDERRRTKGQQSKGARSAHCFLVHPPTLGHYDYFWGFHMFCTLNSLDAVDTRLSFPCPDDPVVGGEEHVLGSANRHAVHGQLVCARVPAEFVGIGGTLFFETISLMWFTCLILLSARLRSPASENGWKNNKKDG